MDTVNIIKSLVGSLNSIFKIDFDKVNELVKKHLGHFAWNEDGSEVKIKLCGCGITIETDVDNNRIQSIKIYQNKDINIARFIYNILEKVQDISHIDNITIYSDYIDKDFINKEIYKYENVISLIKDLNMEYMDLSTFQDHINRLIDINRIAIVRKRNEEAFTI